MEGHVPFCARSWAGVTFFFLLVAAAAASSSACFFFCVAVSGLYLIALLLDALHDIPWTIFSSSWRYCARRRPKLGEMFKVACERRAVVKVALGAMSRWWGPRRAASGVVKLDSLELSGGYAENFGGYGPKGTRRRRATSKQKRVVSATCGRKGDLAAEGVPPCSNVGIAEILPRCLCLFGPLCSNHSLYHENELLCTERQRSPRDGRCTSSFDNAACYVVLTSGSNFCTHLPALSLHPATSNLEIDKTSALIVYLP